MICQACHRLTRERLLCRPCRQDLRPGVERVLPGGVRLVSALAHSGPARTLMHHLKYKGVVKYAEFAASLVADRVPDCWLVPIPRAITRQVRYGVDPSLILANYLSRKTGNPVVSLLSPRAHSARRAGSDHSGVVAPFSLRLPVRSGIVIVDDVVTTGATVTSAIAAVGRENVQMVVSANAAYQVSSLRVGEPIKLVG